ncbi:spore cortex protein [Neisseria leonii]|uniref:spore cortex protein n=1 Tax=Neisseria leonii TaxID=2995413 RepID=UPI00237B2C17|nr:spore cortex protein [Neisseria sp. 3986]MDD9325947.1 spore cortex protein [Neisseria sp. 3986]
MRTAALLMLSLALSACSWETYRNSEGRTGLRPKYEAGTRVYYQDGTYSRNGLNHQYRPEQHAVKPDGTGLPADNRTHWQTPAR